MAAEAISKLNVQLRDLIEIFENHVGESSSALMKSYLEGNKPLELIELCQAYANSMPFIDHDDLALKVKNCLYGYTDCLMFEKKNVKKRLNTLLADTKADKDLVNKVQNQLDDIEDRIHKNYHACVRGKQIASVPLKYFIENPLFYPINTPEFDPLTRAQQNTLKKGYVVIIDKEGSDNKKPLYMKKEEYRKYLSFYAEFPPSKP